VVHSTSLGSAEVGGSLSSDGEVTKVVGRISRTSRARGVQEAWKLNSPEESL